MTKPSSAAEPSAPRTVQVPVVFGPDAQPEPYQWAVRDAAGGVFTEGDPAGGPSRSFTATVDPAGVAWLCLIPQRPGLATVRLRVPPGCVAWFVRRRALAAVNSAYLGSWTGLGWRAPDGTGPSLFFAPDGSAVAGIDDGTLTEGRPA